MEGEKNEASPRTMMKSSGELAQDINDDSAFGVENSFGTTTTTTTTTSHPSLRQRRTQSSTEKNTVDEEQPASTNDIFCSSMLEDKESSCSHHGSKSKKEKSDKEKDEDEDVVEEPLPASIFSLMYLSDINSLAHFYACVIYCVQMIVVIAALLDSFESDAGSNPANIPPGVETAVTVAQGTMIPFAVASQNDFVTAIVRLNDSQWETETIGKSTKDEVNKQSRTMYIRWLISCFSQLFVGFGILCCSFLFMMQSETVFTVLVNIVALFAIANISVVAYNMAAKGFLGYSVWKETAKVAKHKVNRNYRQRSAWIRETILYLLCVGVMYIGYGIVVYRQLSGYYLCHSVKVQFDDEFQPNLPYLSGVYSITDLKIAGRFVYTDEVTQKSFLIGYCRYEKSWGLADFNTGDPCADSILSQPTPSFDVTTTGQVPWRVHSQRDQVFVDTRAFLIQCADCDTTSCQPHRGTCVNNQCVCKDGRYGVHCEFRAPCEALTLNSNHGGFPPVTSLVNEDYVVLDSSYTLFKNDTDSSLVLLYNRPVYYSPGFQYLLLFSGRRWVIVSPVVFAEGGGGAEGIGYETGKTKGLSSDVEDVWKRLLAEEFRTNHVFTHLTNPLLQQFTVSEAVELGSSLDQGSPIGLHWLALRAVRSASRPVIVPGNYETFDATFICPFCEEDVNDCHNLGTCNNGTCECRPGVLEFPLHNGYLCERAVTCLDVQRDHGEILPTGCVGDFQCQEDTGSCDCLDEFPEAGRFCQFLPCFEETIQEKFPGGCANNGTCSNVTGSCICEADLFEGKYCQAPAAGCYEPSAQRMYPPNGCDNGGICNNSTGFCECVSDQFTGRYCQRVRPSCSTAVMQERFPPNGCANNGTCIEETGSCECSSEVFTGWHCDVTELPCTNALVKELYPETGCADDGTCDETTGFCSCNPEQENKGRYCQEEFFVNTTESNVL